MNLIPLFIFLAIVVGFFKFYEDSILGDFLFSNSKRFKENGYLESVYSDLNIDYIDLSDKGEIGNTPESVDTVHRNGLLHRGVWIILLDNKKKHILFTRRSNNTVTCKNSWTILGEHTKIKETYIEAAIRGMKEELELDQSDFKSIDELGKGIELIQILYNSDRLDKQWTKTFVFTLKHTHIFPENRESSEYLWVPIHASGMWILQCNKFRCRSCTDIKNLVVSKDNVDRSHYSMGHLLSQKFIDLVIDMAKRNDTLGGIVPDDDALPNAMHHDDYMTYVEA